MSRHSPLTLVVHDLAEQMKESKALLAPCHRLKHDSGRGSMRLRPPLRPLRGLASLRRTRELKCHDGAADVSIGRLDDEIKDVFGRTRARTT